MLPIQIPSNKEINEGRDTTVTSGLVLDSLVLIVWLTPPFVTLKNIKENTREITQTNHKT